MLKASNIIKKYNKVNALNDFAFQSEKGEIVGLLGPNESGKSTFMRIASGVLPQTSGDILIDDMMPSAKTKKIVSYLPDSNQFPDWFSINDAIDFYVSNYKDFNMESYNEFAEFFKIPDEGFLKSLSKGVLQKLRLALVLARESEYHLLDEPLSGIDPLSREAICEAILQIMANKSCIIISTHLISEVERLLDRAVFINEGENIYEISCDELREEKNMSINDVYKEVFANA